jgi:hypothetical protein
MVLLTMIARIPDGLPLAASMQDDEQVNLVSCKNITFVEEQFNI